METGQSTFDLLNAINVNDRTEKKGKLTYLSWAWAWGELLKRFPDSTYKVYENKDGWIYHTDGKTAWVKTGVTVNGKEYIEMLPVMNYSNQAIPLKDLTSVDVNKTIQRSLTKAIARHGLGLYIYAGEDLPEAEDEKIEPEPLPDDAVQPQSGLDRMETIRLLKEVHHITNNEFNPLYKKYCTEVLHLDPPPLLSKLPEDQFNEMILAVNEELKNKKGAVA